MSKVRIGHASISENGTIRGKAGDQNGKEVFIRNWYRHSKGWVLIRCKDHRMRLYIAEAMEKACANDLIGYDQYQNQTLWDEAKESGYDPEKVDEAVETCSVTFVHEWGGNDDPYLSGSLLAHITTVR